MQRTWDGEPVSPEPPFGASVIVHRRAGAGWEFLILHRANGVAFEGDWAWTPPSGARHPGEPVAECAARELWEETGLRLEPLPVPDGDPEWVIHRAEAPASATVRLSAEHDSFAWVSAEAAAARCLPARVGDSISRVAAALPPCRPA